MPQGNKFPGFNLVLALVLILFAVVFVLIWAFVVMPICNASGWKPPCPPKDSFRKLSNTLIPLTICLRFVYDMTYAPEVWCRVWSESVSNLYRLLKNRDSRLFKKV
jgi:hypothetical protein